MVENAAGLTSASCGKRSLYVQQPSLLLITAIVPFSLHLHAWPAQGGVRQGAEFSKRCCRVPSVGSNAFPAPVHLSRLASSSWGLHHPGPNPHYCAIMRGIVDSLEPPMQMRRAGPFTCCFPLHRAPLTLTYTHTCKTGCCFAAELTVSCLASTDVQPNCSLPLQ